MRTRINATVLLLIAGCAMLSAQVPQIPTLQLRNLLVIEKSGNVDITGTGN
jgi:hypothetical protein